MSGAQDWGDDWKIVQYPGGDGFKEPTVVSKDGSPIAKVVTNMHGERILACCNPLKGCSDPQGFIDAVKIYIEAGSSLKHHPDLMWLLEEKK